MNVCGFFLLRPYLQKASYLKIGNWNAMLFEAFWALKAIKIQSFAFKRDIHRRGKGLNGTNSLKRVYEFYMLSVFRKEKA